MINVSAMQDDEQITPNSAGEFTSGLPVVIPVIEERMIIDKKTVETGKVQIVKKVSEHQEAYNLPVTQEKVQIERVPVNRFVDTAPQVRYEGDTMIVPVVQEVLVVEKRLQLVEELHITTQFIQTQESGQVTLRKEEVTVERIPGEHTNPLSD